MEKSSYVQNVAIANEPNIFHNILYHNDFEVIKRVYIWIHVCMYVYIHTYIHVVAG